LAGLVAVLAGLGLIVILVACGRGGVPFLRAGLSGDVEP
jgi:hypothetical protein